MAPGSPCPAGRLGEHQKVARGILGHPERGARHPARGIVDPAHQGQDRAPALEPVAAAAVDPEEEPLLRHPVAPAPVARWPAAADRCDPRLVEDPAQGPLRDLETLALREQLGEVCPG